MEALIEAQAVELKLPTVRRRFRALAEEATRDQQTPTAYLAALLEAEVSERAERRERRRLIDARFPLMQAPLWSSALLITRRSPRRRSRRSAQGSWIDDRESVILLGDSGTGKTHLAISLAVLACQQGRRVRFTTLAALANELQAAESKRELGRVVARYARTELVVLDELGYLALPEGAARARLPGDLRAKRAGVLDRHHQPPLRRVDKGIPRCPSGQGGRRSHNPPRAHHRHRAGVLALSPRSRTRQQEGGRRERGRRLNLNAVLISHPPTKRGVTFQPAELPEQPIRQDQLHTEADGGWGQLKRPRRGQCG